MLRDKYTPEAVSEIIGTAYAAHQAAVHLVLTACDETVSADERRRALRALRCLSRSRVTLPDTEPLDLAATAVGVVVAGMLRCADRKERRRLAGLVEAILVEAEAIVRRKGSAA